MKRVLWFLTVTGTLVTGFVVGYEMYRKHKQDNTLERARSAGL